LTPIDPHLPHLAAALVGLAAVFHKSALAFQTL
jgi:hypothetical protein